MFASPPIGSAPRPARPGRGFCDRPLAQPGLRSPRGAVRASCGGIGRGDRNTRGRPGSRGRHDRREPGVVGAGRALARRCPRPRRVHAVGGSLPQRDDAARRCDPAAAATPRRAAHFDVALSGAVVRNNARYSPPALPLAEGRPDECEIPARLALIVLGMGPDADPKLVDDQVIATTLGKEVSDPDSPVAGRDVAELTAMLPDGPGYERRLDMMLRLGPFGDGFGADPDGLTLQRLKNTPHRGRPGALQPRIPEVLRTPSGTVELAPDVILDDVGRLHASLGAESGFLLIGRRHLRSNNSWMHNLEALSGGTTAARCRSIPTTPPGWAWRTSRWSPGPAASSRYRWRSPRRSGPGWCLCRTAGATPNRAPGCVSPHSIPASTSTVSTTGRCSIRCRVPRCSTRYRSRWPQSVRASRLGRGAFGHRVTAGAP